MFIIYAILLMAFIGMMMYYGYMLLSNIYDIICGEPKSRYYEVTYSPEEHDGVLADFEGQFSSKRSIEAIECLTGM